MNCRRKFNFTTSSIKIIELFSRRRYGTSMALAHSTKS